jgi:putative protease
MSESLTEADNKIALPLLPLAIEQPSAPSWHDWTALTPLPDAPEPTRPQGVYSDAADEFVVQAAPLDAPQGPVELLAPAGGPEAAFAAFHFGADAIYLGLKKFSARAEAENFTLTEVDEITAYAHSLQPRRRVFVTINTLIRQDELAELVEAIAALADIGVDALIVQDLGVYHLVREHFPQLELHASTQLSVHNRAGAEALRQLGFRRVVLARELTFEEVRDITATSGIETEVFIHGALCYSYSGLCLFSAQTLGRSGNRGKCAYSCRDSYEVADAPLTLRDGSAVRRDPRQGFPFSMKDLALPDHVPTLRAAGVSCFKVEGRKKSPLYVATTTNYYRKLIDGTLEPDERPEMEAEMQSVFSRPWTRLFVQSHKDKEVADRDTVGHRGTLVGEVEAILQGGAEARLRFHTRRTLERHDGLQIDLPVLGKPFGFAVERLWIVTPGRSGKRHEVFEAPADSLVEVLLPREHPDIAAGAPVYCSSSQAVKQKYRHAHPKPGQYRTRKPIAVELFVSEAEVTAVGRVLGDRSSEVRRTLNGSFPPAKDRASLEQAARGAFEKLGDTPLMLDSFAFHNPDNCFVPLSRLNRLRRELMAGLEEASHQDLRDRINRLQATVAAPKPRPRETATAFRWSIKVDRVAFLDAFEEADLAGVDEIIVDIARDHPALLAEKLDHWAGRVGRERLRLALPALTRSWEDRGIRHKTDVLRGSDWNKWEAANLSAWSYLGVDPLHPQPGALDLSTDWSVYVINRLAAQALERMGVRRFTLSPEDGLENVRSLLREFGPRAVLIVHQDTPLFVAESCAYANLIGGCPGKANCHFESMEMVSSHGEKVTALDYHCRTIVLNRGPYCLSNRLDDLRRAGAVCLRADFIYRKYDAAEVRDRWRLLRAGRLVAGGHAANFERGIL